VDRSGDVVVTGTSGTSLDSNGPDYATIKYSSTGVPLWTNRYVGPSTTFDYANAVAVDSSGNVFVTGSSYIDSVTVAYSGAGIPLWTNRYPTHDGSTAIAVTHGDDIIVTGKATLAYSNGGDPLWTNTNPLTAPQQFFRLMPN